MDDELFNVRGLHEIEGYDGNFLHKAGIHDPRKVLEKCPLFEAHELNKENPKPRVSEKRKR